MKTWQNILITPLIAFCIGHAAHARPMPDSFAYIVERLMPAVVNISTAQTIDGQNPFEGLDFPPGIPFEELPELFEQFQNDKEHSPQPQKAISLGSGFVIDPAGYIVTNNHVIEKAEEITVTFNNEKKFIAKVMGKDTKMDIALLKIESPDPLPYVRFGNSDNVRVGDWAIAVGNPFGLGGSVSVGIISARARDINVGPFDDFFQTDAAINRGNSGGPLFSIRGEVIGINTAIFSPSGGNVGIGFATPATLVEPVTQQLKEFGHIFRGWLGVKIQTVTSEIAESVGLPNEAGALVVEVTKDSPAARVGIEPGDVILQFDGKDIVSMRKLPRIVAETKAERTVDMVVFHKGKRVTIPVKVGELKESTADMEEANEAPAENEEPVTGERILGMTVTVLTEEERKRFDLNPATEGLVIMKAEKDSAAYDKGLQPGDVILNANQETLRTTKTLHKIIGDSQKANKKSILLLISRNGETQFVVLPFAKEAKKQIPPKNKS